MKDRRVQGGVDGRVQDADAAGEDHDGDGQHDPLNGVQPAPHGRLRYSSHTVLVVGVITVTLPTIVVMSLRSV